MIIQLIFSLQFTAPAVADKTDWAERSKRARDNVGRVYFGEICVGSCALVRLVNNTMYILTCRHVVFDEDEGGIPTYHLSFWFGLEMYSTERGNVRYHGSSDEERDLSFFQVIGVLPVDGGFGLSLNIDVYQGQSIIIAGFPLAIDDEGILMEDPKILSGLVSAAGAALDIALADISGSMPNMSGGAILGKITRYEVLLGIHKGVYWHEERGHRPIEEEEEVPNSTSEGYQIIIDPTIATRPTVDVVMDDQSNVSPGKADRPDIDALSIVGSPPENVRFRGLYAMENVPHKGSMSYFVPAHTIIRYLAPHVGGKLTGSISKQRAKSSKRSRTREYKTSKDQK